MRARQSHAPRTSRTLPAIVLAVAVALALGAACGGSDKPSRKSPDQGKISGSITVSAAASLTEAFTTLKAGFEKAHPGSKIKLNIGASSMLVDQIQQGAPADVIATADTKSLGTLVASGKVGKPETFARNRLAILVEKGNPKHVRSLADLARSDVVLVLCAPEVPCGKFAAQALARAHVAAQPKSFEDNVKAVVNRVTLGEADAGLVYVSDVVAAGGKAEGIPIPDDQNAVASYPIAVVKGSANQVTDRAFVAYVRSRAGQAVLEKDGFLPARG